MRVAPAVVIAVLLTFVVAQSARSQPQARSAQPAAPGSSAGQSPSTPAVTGGIVSAMSVGVGTTSPVRTLQIGPSLDATFGLEPSDASPRAGYIRFGDNTGWELVFARSRNGSGGTLNTGVEGTLFSIRDDGAVFQALYPLGATGVEPLCRTLSNAITRCQASSLRYKTDLAPYQGGMDVVRRLKPITFTRKLGGRRDIGLAAEEVADVEPLFTFNNDDGQVEGIRYELLSVAVINALKEQQTTIEDQRERLQRQEERIERQERELDEQRASAASQQQEVAALRTLVCQSHRRAPACR
jgi:hypothetical protein